MVWEVGRTVTPSKTPANTGTDTPTQPPFAIADVAGLQEALSEISSELTTYPSGLSATVIFDEEKW